MNDSLNGVIRWSYFIAECGLMVLAFLGAHWLRGVGFEQTHHDAILLMSGLLSWLAVSFWARFHQVYTGQAKRIVACIKVGALFTFMLSLLAFNFKEAGYSRLVVGFFIVLFVFSVYLLHLFGDLYVFVLHRNHKLLRQVLVLGAIDHVAPLCQAIRNHPEFGYAEPSVGSLEWVNDLDALCEVVRQRVVNDLILFIPFGKEVPLPGVFERVESFGVRISIIPDLSLTLPVPLQTGRFFNYPALSLQSFPLDLASRKLCKRVFDMAFSAAVLLLMSPLLVVVGLLVKLSSPGPIFFKQQRTGYNQKTFDMMKFRSMRFDQELADKQQATKGDPRMTPLGRWMRKTNVDELPQFWNVLKGDMSVVGPRPHMLSHTEEFVGRVGGYLRRHYVRPGITGWAQVNGWRGPTDTDEALENRVKCDLWYVENWTLWLDAKIIWLTLFGSKTRKNAF